MTTRELKLNVNSRKHLTTLTERKVIATYLMGNWGWQNAQRFGQNQFTRMTWSANHPKYAQRQNDRRREDESAARDMCHSYANHWIQRLRIIG